MNENFLTLLHAWSDSAMRHSLKAFLRFNQEHGFSLSQINSLFFIDRASDPTMNDLSLQLGVTKAAVSQLIDRMVEQGLVLRQEDPDDRRSKILTLTPSGKEIVVKAIQARHAWLADFADEFSPEDQLQFEPYLAELVGKLTQYHPHNS